MKEDLREMPHMVEMIPRGDPRITPYLSDTLVQGEPDLFYRARDLQDLSQILRYCHSNRIPVTVCGSQTSLTGSSVAFEGVLVSFEQKKRLVDIGVDRTTKVQQATAEPGILLGDFQRQVAEAGFFYPPDPTSKNEAQLGGTIGTNATGEDSLLYGPTRRYVRRLKVLLADGREKTLERRRPYTGPTKNLAGYCLSGDPVDLFVGSEGTLGIVTEVTVDLLPASNPFFLVWAFFPDLDTGLEFVETARASTAVRPRSLELLDSRSLEIVRRQERAPGIPESAGCAISFKQEYGREGEVEGLLGRWLALIEPILKSRGASALADSVTVLQDAPGQERFRLFRHAVPSLVNEEAHKYQRDGGGKVSTDWWVPVGKIRKVMAQVVGEGDALGVPYLAFGHIGDGHPHINYLARNRDEKGRVERLSKRQCERAVALGGGVSGEHGLGKLHRDLLSIQWKKGEVEKMVHLKRQYDPNGILGRGNLFAPSVATKRVGGR